MTCHIYAFAEKAAATNQWSFLPEVAGLPRTSHNLASWLGGVRYGIAPHVPALAANRGFPDDATRAVKTAYALYDNTAFGASWVSVQELLDFDYDAVVEDLRPAYAETDSTYPPVHYHELLGEEFMAHLGTLSRAGATRIIFWFELIEDDTDDELMA